MYDRHLSVGNDLVAGGILQLSGSGGALHVRIPYAGSNEEKIGLDPIALAIHVRVDAMRPFRTTSTIHSGDIVGRGAHPHFLSVVSLGQLPDAQVMALGKSVERFLEDQVRGGPRPAERKRAR